MEISRRKEICVGKRGGNWCYDEEGCTGGIRWLWLLCPAGSLGAPSGPHQCQAAGAVLLLIPLQTKAALWAHLSTASQLPWSPSCHPSISAFISLYSFSVPSEVLFPSLLLHTSSIFLIINVILIQQIPECHNLPVNLSQCYLWRHTSSEKQ